MPLLRAQPEPVEAEFARLAIVVVDMQNAFASRGGMLDRAGVDVSGAAGVVLADCRLQAGPPSLQEATLYNVEAFFGWTVSARELLLHLSPAGWESAGPAGPASNRTR